ncbi:hypothetical protein FKM82_025624 [Ascaphus truei]
MSAAVPEAQSATVPGDDETPSSVATNQGYVLPEGKIMVNTVFVGGIDIRMDEIEIRDFFARFGTVKEVKIITDRTGVSKGYGFVSFYDYIDVRKIVESQNIFHAKKLKLGPAIRKRQNETHFSTTSAPKYFDKQYNQVFLSSALEKKRGVAILVHNRVGLIVNKVKKDREGRFLMLVGSINAVPITIATLYAPNTHEAEFFKKTFGVIKKFSEGALILGGDFNVAMNITLDRSGPHKHKANPRSSALEQGLKDLQLVDAWRETHPLEKLYTFYSHPHDSFSRIDYFFVSSRLVSAVTHTEIHDISWSDHAPIELRCTQIGLERPRANWKLNDSFLKIPDLERKIKEEIKNFFRETKDSVDSHITLWEAHKATLRGVLISMGARKKKAQRKNY